MRCGSLLGVQPSVYANDLKETYHSTMKAITPFLIIPLLLVVDTASAFRVTTCLQSRRPSTTLQTFPERFGRAVECSEKYGLCNVDELLELAEELDSYQGCFFEDKEFLQEKEIKDRSDVADILRLEAELALRHDYLKNANLFKANVDEAVLMRRRDDYLEMMDSFSEY
jgi:hypothetical protein